jgi:MFS family permease
MISDISTSQNISGSASLTGIKWTEVLSLGALNAAIAISWIAYLEYQPVLLQKFQVTHLGSFLVVAKAFILVIVPILAGWLADRILAKKGKFFIVYMVGISTTAMIFMIVASIISVGPDGALSGILPIMIVFWLISMSIFISPAFSMLKSFASTKNLPVVMGAIILITELIYALEPLVQDLVRFFGETLTFIVGGILVLGTGVLFQRVSSDEVLERSLDFNKKKDTVKSSFLPIAMLGLALGVGRAILVEYLPVNSSLTFISGDKLSFFILGLSAIFAFGVSRYVSTRGLTYYLRISLIVMTLAILSLILFQSNPLLFGIGSIILGIAFGAVHLCGLPFAFGKLSARHTTLGIGIFLGASAVAEGLFEIYYAM